MCCSCHDSSFFHTRVSRKVLVWRKILLRGWIEVCAMSSKIKSSAKSSPIINTVQFFCLFLTVSLLWERYQMQTGRCPSKVFTVLQQQDEKSVGLELHLGT